MLESYKNNTVHISTSSAVRNSQCNYKTSVVPACDYSLDYVPCDTADNC